MPHVITRTIAVQQVILRQRPSQIWEANIRGSSATVVGRAVFESSVASTTFLSRSDTSNDHQTKQKQRDHDQPN